MPPSGSVPLKPFLETRNELTARITRRPLPGSVPSKWFALMKCFFCCCECTMGTCAFKQRKIELGL
eukprot:2664206-Amphidinium_carterae.1